MTKIPRLTLGERLQKARKIAPRPDGKGEGLDQGEMAAALSYYGVNASQTTISNWENDGAMRNQLKVLLAWAKVCDIQPAWLIEAVTEELDEELRSDLDLRTIRCNNVSADQPRLSRGKQLATHAA